MTATDESDENDEIAGVSYVERDGVRTKVCATCKTEIDQHDWHPVSTSLDEEEGVRIYLFCDADCRDRWEHTTGNSERRLADR